MFRIPRIALIPVLLVPLAVALHGGDFSSSPAGAADGTSHPAKPQQNWLIAAPGLVEPAGGNIRLGSEVPGRVILVMVALRDKVKAGQILVQLSDGDALARVRSAEAQVEIRERNRNNNAATRRGRRRRAAADDLANTEEVLFASRRALDRLQFGEPGGSKDGAALEAALKRIADAQTARDDAEKTLEEIAADDGTPLYSQGESSLELARAEQKLALNALEKTRVRAPFDGTILRINVKSGEVVGPQSREPLLVIGDLSTIRVRAEVDERSVGDVAVGQKAIVRSEAFNGKDFKATVTEIAAALGPGRIGKSQLGGPRNTNVLEVLLEVEGATPLISGMEVDILFEGGAEGETSDEGDSAATQ